MIRMIPRKRLLTAGRLLTVTLLAAPLPAAPLPAAPLPAAPLPAASLPAAPLPAATPKIVTLQTGDCNWLQSRGDQALNGRTTESLPTDLVLLWEHKTGAEIKSSPVVAGGKVFIGSSDGSVYALSLADGSRLWQFSTPEDAFEAPPLAAFDRIYIGSLEGVLYALAPNDGQLLWKYRTGGQISGSANWFSLNDGKTKRIIVGSYDSKLHCIDALSGRGIWSRAAESYINGSPTFSEGKVIFGSCDALIYILEGKSGKQLQVIDAGSYIPGSVAVEGKRAFAGHYGNKVLAVDLSTGRLDWEFGDEKKGSAFFASPALGPEGLVIGDRDGTLYYLNRRTGAVIWSFCAADSFDASPVIAGSQVIAASVDGFLYLLNLADGKLLWKYEIGAAVTGSPAVVCNRLIVGADDNRVYTFGSRQAAAGAGGSNSGPAGSR